MMNERIVVIGSSGQLGSALVPLLGEAASPLTHAEIELTDPTSISSRMNELRPDIIVNCAAYNFVDRAEEEPERAFAVNAFGVRNLAQWCGSHNAALMHISTDYVFGLHSGDGAPWTELDCPGPVSVYGGSKLAGEWFVRSLCPRHWVVRTCGLYGTRDTRSASKGNFVETMLRLAGERPELRIVSDQRCTPTSAADLAVMLAALCRTEAYGLYHATNAGDCTWYEFACEIVRQAGLSPRLTPISSAEFGAKARRPSYSVLNSSKIANVTGISLRPWQQALSEYLLKRK